MCACVRVCVCACVHVCVRMYVHVRECMRTSARVRLSVTYENAYAFVHMCTHKYLYT